jgi:hypothetical protein
LENLAAGVFQVKIIRSFIFETDGSYSLEAAIVTATLVAVAIAFRKAILNYCAEIINAAL